MKGGGAKGYSNKRFAILIDYYKKQGDYYDKNRIILV